MTRIGRVGEHTRSDALFPIFELDVAHGPIDVARVPQLHYFRPLLICQRLFVLVLHAHHTHPTRAITGAITLFLDQALDRKWNAIVLFECLPALTCFEKLVALRLEHIGLHNALISVLLLEIQSHIHTPCTSTRVRSCVLAR